MSVTPIDVENASANLREVYGEPIATQIETVLEQFIAMDSEERQVAMYSTMLGLCATLTQYKPLLEHAAKRLNGKRFGK